jgi:hypothetical protein
MRALDAFNGVSEFDEVGGTYKRGKWNKVPKYPKVVQPPNYTATLNLPAEPTTAEIEAFREGIEGVLDDFFGEHFSPSDAYAAAEAWVLDALTTGDPKLPGNGLTTIWGRAQQHTQALGNDLAGLTLPSESNVTHQTAAYEVFATAEQFAREAAKIDLWNHAAGLKLRDLRADAIQATGNYLKALTSADTVAATASTAILEAESRMRAAAASWYLAQLGPVRRDTARAVISKTEDRSNEMIADDLLVRNAELSVNAAIQGAGAVAKVAQAAAASTNSIISSSTAVFS